MGRRTVAKIAEDNARMQDEIDYLLGRRSTDPHPELSMNAPQHPRPERPAGIEILTEAPTDLEEAR